MELLRGIVSLVAFHQGHLHSHRQRAPAASVCKVAIPKKDSNPMHVVLLSHNLHPSDASIFELSIHTMQHPSCESLRNLIFRERDDDGVEPRSSVGQIIYSEDYREFPLEILGAAVRKAYSRSETSL